MPEQRKDTKRYLQLLLEEVTLLLQAPEHGFRMCVLLTLVAQYKKEKEKHI